MSNSAPASSPLHNLKKAADRAAESGKKEDKIDRLSEAFEMFSQETARLEKEYSALREEYQTLNTRLKHAKEYIDRQNIELDQTATYLKIILNSMAQGLLFLDKEGTIRIFNPAAEKLLDQSSSEVLYKQIWDVFSDDFFKYSIKQILKGEKVAEEISEDIPFSDKILNVTFSHIYSEKNETIEGLLILIRDMTEIQTLKEYAERDARMKQMGEMVSKIAHEIRNPLGGIKGFASLLEKDLQGNNKLQQMAANIVKGTEDLNQMLTDILNYSKPITVQKKTINIAELIKKILYQLKGDETIKQKVTFHFDQPKKPLYVSADGLLLQSVLVNLIMNGAQAIENKGEIFISIEQTDKFVQVKVKDTGEGIAEENIPKIFQLYFTTKGRGSGLGLSEVKRILDAHRGDISVTSSVGKGSTFTISLMRDHEDRKSTNCRR